MLTRCIVFAPFADDSWCYLCSQRMKVSNSCVWKLTKHTSSRTTCVLIYEWQNEWVHAKWLVMWNVLYGTWWEEHSYSWSGLLSFTFCPISWWWDISAFQKLFEGKEGLRSFNFWQKGELMSIFAEMTELLSQLDIFFRQIFALTFFAISSQ